MNRDPRRQIGQLGEQLAAEHLVRQGLTILERNYRTRHGEIDLVAKGETILIFCEVKTRCKYTDKYSLTPLISITPHKQRQVRRMARQWLSERQLERAYVEDLRFDGIGVTLDRKGSLLAIEHLEAAF